MLDSKRVYWTRFKRNKAEETVLCIDCEDEITYTEFSEGGLCLKCSRKQIERERLEFWPTLRA